MLGRKSIIGHFLHDISKRFVALLFLLVLLLVAVIGNVDTRAQGWRPAATIEGAVCGIDFIQLEDGTTLIPMRDLLPNQKDTYLLFSVEQLLTDKQPWPVQLPGKMREMRGVFHNNDNRHPEVLYRSHSPYPFHVIVDAFSAQQQVIVENPDGKLYPNTANLNAYNGDIDGDGINDNFTAHRDSLSAYIVWGEYGQPYQHHSVVPSTGIQSGSFKTILISVGKLSGKPVMLQAMFKSEYNGSGHYQLLELNQDDLTNRRDTIRTTLLNETPNPDLWLFNTKILKADTIWHLFTEGFDETLPSLQVSVGQTKIAPSNSLINRADHKFWFGPRKSTGDWSFPVIMEANRFIVGDIFNASYVSIMRVYRCTNTDNATLTPFADGVLQGGSNQSASISRCMLIPDHDGDDLEDIVIFYSWRDETTNEPKSGTSIFLTSQIPPVSVSNNESVFNSDTSQALNAYFTGTQWIVPQAAWCTNSGSGSSENAAQHNVAVYSITCELITHLTATAQATDLIITHDTSLPHAPMWAVVGECVVQLR